MPTVSGGTSKLPLAALTNPSKYTVVVVVVVVVDVVHGLRVAHCVCPEEPATCQHSADQTLKVHRPNICLLQLSA